MVTYDKIETIITRVFSKKLYMVIINLQKALSNSHKSKNFWKNDSITGVPVRFVWAVGMRGSGHLGIAAVPQFKHDFLAPWITGQGLALLLPLDSSLPTPPERVWAFPLCCGKPSVRDRHSLNSLFPAFHPPWHRGVVWCKRVRVSLEKISNFAPWVSWSFSRAGCGLIRVEEGWERSGIPSWLFFQQLCW